MNRAARRSMMRESTGKSRALVSSYTKQQRIDALIKNGITAEDLKRAYEEGREKGFAEANVPIVKSCYAALVNVLHDEFQFSDEECYRALRAFDEKVVYSLSHTELAEEAFEKTGIELMLDEPFDRVRKTEKD